MRLSELHEDETSVSRQEAERWFKRFLLAIGSAIPELKFEKVNHDRPDEIIYHGKADRQVLITLGTKHAVPIMFLDLNATLELDTGPAGHPLYRLKFRLNAPSGSSALATKLMDQISHHLGRAWVVIVPTRTDILGERDAWYAPAEWRPDLKR